MYAIRFLQSSRLQVRGSALAALSTIIGQGVTLLFALIYFFREKMLQLKVESGKFASLSKSIIKVGVSPFGLTMTPNISLIIINRFSIFYGGDQAVAVYACIAYILVFDSCWKKKSLYPLYVLGCRDFYRCFEL